MKYFSEATRQRMSQAAKRRAQSPAFREQVLSYWQPFCTEEELRQDYETSRMSQKEITHKYGVSLKRVQTSMRRYGIRPRPQVKGNQEGPENASWKGNVACYTAFHNRVYALKGRPCCCDVCGTTEPEKSYDWANLTGRYDDPADYKRMCRSCHWKYDGTIKNITKAKEVSNARESAANRR